mmetsp:Transcript_118969/g.210295  ORF Transcript_118969/g.210295 Transcript_118969/m.210295 type:complete len:392 (-) Transcript_118969:106-1281(-)
MDKLHQMAIAAALAFALALFVLTSSPCTAPLSRRFLQVTGSPMTTTTTSSYFYSESDCDRYLQWGGRKDDTCNSMPRVLLYTWSTENTFADYRNEVYWKACYAHMHGFDLLIADPFHVDTAKDWRGWYTNFNLWAWWVSLVDQVPKYDYVFTTGADVKFSEEWLHFPVWAFNPGHSDLSIMDQCYSDWGLNENAFLFKNTDWSMSFLRNGLTFKDKDIIQGDNGGWMEMLLIAFGDEALSRGEDGYSNKCLPHLLLDEPLEKVLNRTDDYFARKNQNYSKCFFAELDRLAGPYNQRFKSDHVAFNPLLNVDNKVSYSSIPWANCWSHLHDPFYAKKCVQWNATTSCFAFHWNGLSKLLENHTEVRGTCPDPTFRWDLSPYNTINRMGHKSQ